MRDIQIAKAQLFQTLLETSLPHQLCLVDHAKYSHFRSDLRPDSAVRAEEGAALAPGKGAQAVWGAGEQFLIQSHIYCLNTSIRVL